MTPATRLRSSVDISLGLAALMRDATAAVNRRGVAAAGPLVGLVGRNLTRITGSASLAESLELRGVRLREEARVQLSHLLDQLVPPVIAAVLQRIDLTAIVHEQVDVDRLVKDVDLDAAASRLDVEAVAGRLDVDAVAARLDLEAVVDRLDLTRIVLERVDMDRVIPDVLDHVDLVGIAEYLVDEIDLPQIVRDSSGALASDTVRGVRMRGVAGDRAIQRARNRMFHRTAGSDSPEP